MSFIEKLSGAKGLLTGVAVGLTLGYSYCSSRRQAKKSKSKGLLEYSVVYTDRALNLMSSEFQVVMRDISDVLCEAYKADKAVIVPGSGTYGMEAVARQFGQDEAVMVIRNGYFSYRWTDIFEVTGAASSHNFLCADCDDRKSATPKFSPHDLDAVIAEIKQNRPKVVFAPHIETSTGMILPDEYIQAVTAAVHEVGGLFVLDAIAAGTVFADMKKLDVDVVISAPQKGWSGPACCAFVMMSSRAVERMKDTNSQSFATNLKAWANVMDTYNAGSFKYYTTLPTNSLRDARDAMLETKAYGYQKASDDLWTLGKRVRASLASRGYASVAAPGYESPGVVVVYAKENMVSKFKTKGIQVAGGVPFKLNEPKGLVTFRIGLFGLDKINNIDRTVTILEKALDAMQ